jgi:hypothetical protein
MEIETRIADPKAAESTNRILNPCLGTPVARPECIRGNVGLGLLPAPPRKSFQTIMQMS